MSALVIAVVLAVAGGVALLALNAFLPPLSQRVVMWWVKFYTLGVPGGERRDRLAEIESDLAEQKAEALAQGYRPQEVAVHVLWRVVAGLPGDLSWRMERELSMPRRPSEKTSRVPGSLWVPETSVPNVRVITRFVDPETLAGEGVRSRMVPGDPRVHMVCPVPCEDRSLWGFEYEFPEDDADESSAR